MPLEANDDSPQGEFTLDDFKKQLGHITRLGPLRKVMGMIPGMGGMLDSRGDVAPEDDLKQLVGIIDAMTSAEKRTPKIIGAQRRRRIAAGAGAEPHQVNELVKMFEPLSQMMKAMAGKGVEGRMKMFNHIKGEVDRPDPPEPPMPWNPRG